MEGLLVITLTIVLLAAAIGLIKLNARIERLERHEEHWAYRSSHDLLSDRVHELDWSVDALADYLGVKRDDVKYARRWVKK